MCELGTFGYMRRHHDIITMKDILINISRRQINKLARQAAPFNASVFGHFIAGKPVANRAWIRLPEDRETSIIETLLITRA